jgi:uncharacterized protein (DUF1684 family)
MKYAIGVTLLCLFVGCSRQQWPDPPAVELAQYQKDYERWLFEQQNTARESSIIVGIWSLEEGETPFGSDTSLPIVLPASVPGRAGVIRRSGETVTVTPARGVALQGNDGKPVTASTDVLYAPLTLGSLRMLIAPMGDGRVFVSASDEAHPVLKDFPRVQTYPVDQRWRVAARYDAFEQPKMMKIADVRGGSTDYPATGRLTFRIDDQEQQLTAFQFPDSKEFFVLFKDATNATTTYGFRMFGAPVVTSGQWTVIDFNVARNPPCAYSPYTTCPLPPPENRLAVAIEAGEKQFPTGKGFVQQ